MQLHEFNSHIEAQAYFTTKKVTKNEAINHDATFGVEEIMDTILNGVYPQQLKIVARVYKKVMNGALDDINVFDPTTQAAFQALQDAGFYDATMRNHIEDYGRVYPFGSVTEAEHLAAIVAYSELTTIDLPWNNESKLQITVNDDLHKPSNCVLFYSDDFLTSENIGRAKRLDKKGNYEIDLRGVQRKGTLHINFNIKANATCELV